MISDAWFHPDINLTAKLLTTSGPLQKAWI